MKRVLFKKGLILTAAIAGLMSSNIFGQDIASALLLTKSEQYDKAGAMLNQLIQKEPANSKNYFYLGENMLLDYYSDTISNSLPIATKAAREIFQKGVSANAGDPLNYVGLAKVANMLGDNKTATEMRTKARSLLLPYKNIKKIVPPAKDYAFALAKIAESYINNGEVDTAAALPLIRQAVIIDSKNPEIYLIAGDIYIMAIDGSNAIKNYNLAQYADPKSPTANMKIGNIYVRGKNLQVAIPYFEEAIALDANYAPAYRELGQLYWMAQRLEQSKTNFKKYLELTAGNIPAKTRYVNSLFYAGDYEEVIKNVEEILAVDDSRAYMNRLAGYSYCDKKNPDYKKALEYMDKLFEKVPEDRILPKDHHYVARIIMKKNLDLPKMTEELGNLEQQLQKSKSKYNSATAADKTKLKPALDELTSKYDNLKSNVAASEKELDRGFREYAKVIELKPQDNALRNELAQNYYSFKKYDDAAKTWGKIIDPAKDDIPAYMKVGRAYNNGNNLKSADSVFNIVIRKNPEYLDAYVWSARTYSKMDPDYKTGVAKPKFEKVISVAAKDSLKNNSEMMEAFGYLGWYYSEKGNYSASRSYYNRMINLDPRNKDNKIKGYNGLGQLESYKVVLEDKTIEGKLAILGRALEAYDKILALEPNNAQAKASRSWVQEYIAKVKTGINPNEIKGTVKNAAGQPIAFASVKIKDTAAETFTNAKGEYKFEISQSSEILVISAKGYASKEIPVTKSRIYNVVLEK
ncbi:MAG: tetratricopeptide repeat protein [Bacteroidia bacterium]|nr:tetratricopeptide repeat protein [Bacteroidia bacterium]